MCRFKTEVLVDFLDDALCADHVLNAHDVEAMMRTLADAGVRRVVWAYYGDGHGGWMLPEGIREGRSDYGQCRAAYRALGNPLRLAVEYGHRYGLEVYAYFKPYETGVSMVIPEGSPEAIRYGLLSHVGGRLAAMDPFVLNHPQMRIHRCPGPVAKAGPICAMKLIKRDAGSTRVDTNHLQLWTSEHNYRYERLPARLQVSESIEPAPVAVRDQNGVLLTRQGDPVRILTLSGFHIDAPYVLVTTDYTEGPSDFSNSGAAMLKALDDEGAEIRGVTASGAGCWLASRVDFRQWGLIFDWGWGRSLCTLDEANTNGHKGIIAFARGKNPTLPTALCETEPRVQTFWLDNIREMINAGVDGVDFREENHSTHTDEPEAYGYNPVVLEQCRPGMILASEVARVRGDAYTVFLNRARGLLADSGRKMRYHLNMDWFRPDPPPGRALAFPANIRFDWRRWIKDGLLDEAVLRSYHYRTRMLTDPFGAEVVEACHAAGIPVCFNHHVFDDDSWYREEAFRVAADGRFTGLILYESHSFLRMTEDGRCVFTLPEVERICREQPA